MTDNESDASTKNNPLVRALARWEWEGGTTIEPEWEKRAALIEEEDHILHCLGAAVILRWNSLPTEVQRQIFADGGGPLDGGLIMDSAGKLCGTTYGGGAYNHGTVFEISPSGIETLVHSFEGVPNDGAGPQGQLIMDSAGNIFGTTYGGGMPFGVVGAGAVFKIDPTTSKESIIYSFIGGSTTDGTNPEAGVIMDRAGNLYGTTDLGGAFGYEGGWQGGGTVFGISSVGKESVLHSFAGLDGIRPEAGLIMDSNGNLYGAALGGEHDYGAVFEISATGQETVLYSFEGPPSDGTSPIAGLIMGGNGNLYGTTYSGGASGYGTVFEVSPTGQETVLYSFKGPPGDGMSPAAALIVDSAGNLYGTTRAGGVDDVGTVFKINPTTGKETVLYTFESAVGTTDGTDPQGQLVIDSAGNLFGMTRQGGANDQGTVFKID